MKMKTKKMEHSSYEFSWLPRFSLCLVRLEITDRTRSGTLVIVYNQKVEMSILNGIRKKSLQ